MKIGVIFIISLVLFSFLASIIVLAQDEVPGLPTQLQDPEETIQQAKNKTLSSYEYLSKEWQTILLKNKVISVLDSFFRKINIVFRILFGQDYDLSIKLLLVILLWIWIASRIGEAIAKTSNLGEVVPWVIGILSSVVLAQIQVLRYIIEGAIRLLFLPENWFVRLIIFIILALVVGFMHKLSSIAIGWLKQRQKVIAEQMTKISQKAIQKFSDKIQKD